MSPYLSGFLLQSDRLKQVKTIETARWDLVKGDRDRLIEVKITIIKGHINIGGLLNTVLLNTGSTVNSKIDKFERQLYLCQKLPL